MCSFHLGSPSTNRFGQRNNVTSYMHRPLRLLYFKLEGCSFHLLTNLHHLVLAIMSAAQGNTGILPSCYSPQRGQLIIMHGILVPLHRYRKHVVYIVIGNA